MSQLVNESISKLTNRQISKLDLVTYGKTKFDIRQDFSILSYDY